MINQRMKYPPYSWRGWARAFIEAIYLASKQHSIGVKLQHTLVVAVGAMLADMHCFQPSLVTNVAIDCGGRECLLLRQGNVLPQVHNTSLVYNNRCIWGSGVLTYGAVFSMLW